MAIEIVITLGTLLIISELIPFFTRHRRYGGIVHSVHSLIRKVAKRIYKRMRSRDSLSTTNSSDSAESLESAV